MGRCGRGVSWWRMGRLFRDGEGVMTMAEPDCEICKLMGLRACDVCGNPIQVADELNPATLVRDAFGRELCVYCA